MGIVMKSPYFNTDDRIAALRAECMRWKGTPFKHWTGVCGRGTDCVHFVVRVLDCVGALQGYKYKIPKYNRDWHIHNADELLFDGLKAVPFIEPVDGHNRHAGDIMLYHYGKASSHCAIYLDSNIYHSIEGCGVIRTSLRDKRFSKPSHMLRIFER